MAITQARMLELIRITDNCKAKLLDIQRAIEKLLHDLPPNATNEELWGFTQSMQLLAKNISISPQDLEILAIEKAHFKLNATRNAREAKRQRERRNQNLEAKSPRSTAPESIHVKHSPKYSHITREMAASTNTNFSSKFAPKTNNSLIAGINEDLANQKLSINKLYESKNMRAPYPDFLDDSQPLQQEHLRALGLEAQEEEGELF